MPHSLQVDWLPAQVDSLGLFTVGLRKGVVVIPGRVYSKGARYQRCIRLSFQEISRLYIDAVRTVGLLAEELCRTACLAVDMQESLG